MKLMRKSKLSIAIVSVVIIGVIVYKLLLVEQINSDYKGTYIDSVVMVYQAVKSNLTKTNQLDNPEKLYQEWNKLGGVRDATKVIFGRSGELAVFSEKYDMVIVIQPTVDSSNKHGWNCSTYPRMSSETLCSMLNQ